MATSANKLWKESGTTLSFKEWIEREKSKYSSEPQHANFANADGASAVTPTTLFGLDTATVIIAGSILLFVGGYIVYQRIKKK